jgi:hypothetical protein
MGWPLTVRAWISDRGGSRKLWWPPWLDLRLNFKVELRELSPKPTDKEALSATK